MPIAVDEVQQVRDAIVECLDTYAPIVAVTGRPNRNVVPIEELAAVRTEPSGTSIDMESGLPLEERGHPAIGYTVVTSVRGGAEIGNWWTHTVQFDAESASPAVTNALLHQVKEGLTNPRLAANANYPLDASLRRDLEQRLPQLEGSTPDAVRAGLQLTLVVKHS